jgi:hypothetical protein
MQHSIFAVAQHDFFVFLERSIKTWRGGIGGLDVRRERAMLPATVFPNFMGFVPLAMPASKMFGETNT